MADGIGHGTRRRREALARRRRGRWFLVAGVVVVAGLLLVAVPASLSLIWAGRYVADLPDLADQQALELAENSIVYDRAQRRLAVLANESNRQRVPLRRVSKWMPMATVAVEDRRFYEHNGVDWYAITRAVIVNARSGSVQEGGSTLTQQLIKTAYGDKEVTFDRKIREAWLALQAEREYGKDQIIELYLNTVFYGNAAVGIEAAAQTYFRKHASQLDLAESALLAGLPQAPTTYEPYNNPGAARQRRDEVLRRMRDQGMIDRQQYLEAVGRPLGVKRGGSFYGQAREEYVVEFVRSELRADPRFAGSLTSGGLRIRTTIDPRLQGLAQRTMDAVLTKPVCSKKVQRELLAKFTAGDSGVSAADCDPAAAIVSIRPKTGEIVAMKTTADFSIDSFNLAAQARRQAGSTFKAVTLTAAIEAGIDPNATEYVSERTFVCPPPLCYEEQAINGDGLGPVTIAEGVRRSDNTVFFQLALDLGPRNVVDMAQRLGGIPPGQLAAVPSVTLGASGVSPLQMTTIFATLGAGGVYREPHVISQVRRVGSDKVVGFTPKGRRVVSDGVADAAAKVLETNMQSGLGTSAALQDGRAQGGKSGTTDEHWDAWFCGFTPDLATCVWLGYPLAEIPMNNVEGVSVVQGPTLPSAIWRAYMTEALSSTPPSEWTEPKRPAKYTDFVSELTQRAFTVSVPAADPSTTPTDTVATDTSPGGGVITVG